MATIHVFGAGLSGLACALHAAKAGREVILYEATARAGGRCRSFHDDSLACTIDNGSHLLLGGNEATRAYLGDIGSADSITEINPARFPFHDVATDERWCIRPTAGVFPRWLLSASRRVPGTGVRDYLAAVRLARATPEDTVADCVGTDGVLYNRLWQPLSRAVLNTDADEASAQLLWKMIAATFLKGEAACRPIFFHNGLSKSLIDPAVKTLIDLGAQVRMSARLRGLRWTDYRVRELNFAEGVYRIGTDDAVVLAVPPDICGELWPETNPPTESRAIVNAHFRLSEPLELPWKTRFLGIVNAEAQWLFVRDNILSITVSAADRLVDRPSWELANLLWSEASRALRRNVGRIPPWRVIKERRATIAQTPAANAMRSGPGTTLENLFIAGDWTATGLPATIESSISSGFAAARQALRVTGASAAA